MQKLLECKLISSNLENNIDPRPIIVNIINTADEDLHNMCGCSVE